jgi:acetolactate synthase I/II/III large subunit
MNGAMLVAQMLRAYDVKYLFGVPGDTNVPLYGALAQLRNSIQHVLARDERSAGYMADAYARVSNKPGIVEVPSGAGAMYVLPAVAEAHGSCVPMIVLTSDTPLSGEGRGVITELDCARLFEPITKGSFLIKSAAKIPETMRRAFRLATTGRPGAVHIAIPEDIFHDKVALDTVSLHAEPACRTFPAYPPRAAQQDIAELLKIASGAQRPLVVVGGGVNRSRAGAELLAFVERYRLPVVTTITGQNAILDTHELSIGIAGDNGFHPHANRAMEEADLLLYFGCRNGSVVSIGWTFPAPRAGRGIIQVDIDPAVLGNNAENLLSIHSDARLALQDLLAHPRVSNWATDPTWVDTLNAWRRTFWTKASSQLGTASQQPLRAQYVIDALNRHMRQPHLLFADPGTPTPYLGRFLRLADRDAQLFIPRAFGGLGYAIPAVVGGWYARPDLRPIGLFGDGSMGMCAGELETLARLRVPAILINFNNACFGWIKALQRLHGPRDFMSVDFTAQDYGAVARDFGLHALRVETEKELDAALAQAFRHDGPVLLDVIVESIAEQLPPVYNWLRQTGVDPLTVDGRQLGLQTTPSNREKIA